MIRARRAKADWNWKAAAEGGGGGSGGGINVVEEERGEALVGGGAMLERLVGGARVDALVGVT